MAVVTAADVRRSTSDYIGALSDELVASCDRPAVWSQQGRGLAHGLPILIAVTLLMTLLRQIASRCRGSSATGSRWSCSC